MMDDPHIVAALPVPPSVNALWVQIGKRRVKTREYAAWRQVAGYSLAVQVAGDSVPGAYRLRITMPKTRGDLGNYEKAISDLLVEHGVVPDDRHAVEITLRRDNARDDPTALVEVWAI